MGKDKFYCDSFLDIKQSVVSFVPKILKLDIQNIDEKSLTAFSKRVEKVVATNLRNKVEIFTTTILNHQSYNLIGEKEINAILKTLGIKSKIFDEFYIQIGSFFEEEQGSGDYSGFLFCDFGKELGSFYPQFNCLQGTCELAQITPLCVDELKYDVQKIEDNNSKSLYY
jgi:hypothetical protein